QRNLVSVTGCDSTVVTNLSVEQTASQTIYLDAGWNIISSYLIPEDVNIEAVMASLQGSGDLVKVQDESNNTFEYRNKNIGWVNGIGDLQKTEGYKVQVNTNCALEVKGQKVVLPLDVPLSGGWNIISFPFNESVDAMQVVQSLIDAEILIKVQDEAGNSIEYWNDRGWINGIGNFEPGEGYIIHVKSDGIFAIDETYTKSGLILAKNAEATYFQVDYEGNGFDHMNINIIELAGSDLKVGDEIAAYDNAICVGAVKLTEQHFELDAVSIPASASEEGQNNGYLDGNSIELKVWSRDTNEEIDISAETIEGEMVYNRQASVFVALSGLSVSTNDLVEQDVEVDVYPNPASNNLNIRFSAMPEFGTIISIYDMAGKRLITKEVETDITVMNIENLQSGAYIVQVPVNGRIIPHKLIKR
ncbi:MAG: T9SS type A sorting domain-containing protein, partial [Mariniphaga sp.]